MCKLKNKALTTMKSTFNRLKLIFGKYKKLLIYSALVIALILVVLLISCNWEYIYENDEKFRNIGLIIGGIVGFILALWRTNIASENTKIADRNSITDTFTRAIEQLGATKGENKPNIEVRLGAIYALEKLSKSNADYYQTIIDILVSYIRENAGARKYKEEKEQSKPKPIRIDIQTALNVLALRSVKDNEPELNLSQLNLSGVMLRGANLSRTILIQADLTKSSLLKTNLSGSHLIGANLSGSNLIGTNLTRANLFLADLEKAKLKGNDLTGANLTGANLTRANLTEANLLGAKLEGTKLEGTKLEGTKLEGANLIGADLRRADLIGAVNLTCEQLKTAKNWQQAYRDAKLACGAEIPEKPKKPNYLRNKRNKKP